MPRLLNDGDDDGGAISDDDESVDGFGGPPSSSDGQVREPMDQGSAEIQLIVFSVRLLLLKN